jgi:hypothetical protein
MVFLKLVRHNHRGVRREQEIEFFDVRVLEADIRRLLGLCVSSAL